MKNRVFKITLLFLVLLFAAAMVIQAADDLRGSKRISKVYKTSSTLEGGAKGDSYGMNINNFYLPFNRKGIMAAVNVPPFGSDGRYPGGQGNNFLFSSGFFLSGVANGQVFANAVASASLVEDYLQGTVADGSNDPRAQIYVVRSDDPPFGTAWQEWADAVDLGADFYDGDGDGVYNPVDLNGNGEWDPDEDRPDLIGDETAWMVYWDAVPAGQRRWNTVNPIGIEVRQTIFGFASAGAIGNMLFVRYRFKYVGLNNPEKPDPDVLEDCYFGVWADPDLGDHNDDLVGADMARNAGYVYNDGSDAVWGNNPPVFLIDFFSGPIDYIPGVTFEDVDGDGVYTDGVDIPLDTAYSIQGQIKGVVAYPGARNQGLTSFVQYINSDSYLRDPSNAREARNYTLGKDIEGLDADPCNWAYGDVLGGVDCATVNPNIWYNGDPVTQTGWINNKPADVRMMQNTGPFDLKKGEENEIMVAYIVGQGVSARNSITEARNISDGAQFIFDNNFLSPAPPPAVTLNVEANDDFIDLIWETPDQVSYKSLTDAWDLNFQGYNLWTFRTRTAQETVANLENKKLLRRYSLNNNIENLFKENPNTGGIEPFYEQGSILLNYSVYTDPKLGKIRVRIDRDPWTEGELIKGKPYYFAVTSFAVNYNALVNKETGVPGYGVKGDYYLSSGAFVGDVENIPRIVEVIVGKDIYQPPTLPLDGTKLQGASSGIVQYDVVDKEALTGDTYQVNFFVDSVATGTYRPYWRLTNKSSNSILIDSSKSYLYGVDQVAALSPEGFIVRVENVVPKLGNISYSISDDWLDTTLTRYFYLNRDVPEFSNLPNVSGLSNLNSTYTKANSLRRVEIRFGGNGKAYRYLNGYLGGFIGKRNSYIYAEAVTAADTAGNGFVGMLGEGFVDVPFTAWVVDPNFGQERQLAVGFVEKASALGGKPDGIWNPGTSINDNYEYIFIFDADYDPQGNQQVYKGFSNGTTMSWADLRGGNNYQIPADALNAKAEDRKIARSPFLNTLYAISVTNNDSPINGDKIIIDVDTYPFTPDDVFEFTTVKGGALSSADEKELFDKVNVFPNPLFGFNPATSWTGQVNNADEPFVTFSNLPTEVTIKIYSLSGQLLRTLNTNDKDSPTSPFLRWDLLNENGLRVASGLYLAIVSSPKFGEKVLKFSIIMPQKQMERF